MKTPPYVIFLFAAVALSMASYTFLSFAGKPTGPIDEAMLIGIGALATMARPVITGKKSSDAGDVA